MRIAAVYDSDGKVFGTIHDNQFKKLLIDGAPVRDLRQVIALVEKGPAALKYAAPVALDGVKLAAPVGPLTKNVMCVGKNYHDHAQEFARSGVDQSGDKQESPSEPVVFTKATSSLSDPFQPISASSDPTHSVDYEGELGVVIARRCHQLTESDDVRPYILGYTCVNDFTARDLQNKDSQWTRAKGFDTFCPVGPVVADGLDPWAGVPVETRVNGEVRQSGNTRDFIFSLDAVIRYISQIMTLEPGDLIATGTPKGVGPVVAGDAVEVSIEGIGQLRNPIANQP